MFMFKYKGRVHNSCKQNIWTYVYIALANTTYELTWIKYLFKELKISLPSYPGIWCDNLSIVTLSANHVCYAHTKNVEWDFYFVHNRVLASQLLVMHLPSSHQLTMCLLNPSMHLNSIFFITNSVSFTCHWVWGKGGGMSEYVKPKTQALAQAW